MISNVGKDVEKLNLAYIAVGNVKWCSHSERVVAYKLLHNPAIALLGIHRRKIKTYFHVKICTKLFTALLFLSPKVLQSVNG